MNSLEKKLYLLSRLKEGVGVKLATATSIGLGLKLEEIHTVRRILEEGSPITIIIESNDSGLLNDVRISEIESIITKPIVPNHYKQRIVEIVR